MTVELHNVDCIEFMDGLEDKSLNAIVCDPPYKYLQHHKLDRDFDEDLYFKNVKRILKDDGFYVTFGRGESFYRWNNTLSNMGFVFKEEVIWNKNRPGSITIPLLRYHETISIFTPKSGKIRTTYVPYMEAKKHRLDMVISDIKGIKTTLNNTKVFDEILNFVEQYEKDGTINYVGEKSKRPKRGNLLLTNQISGFDRGAMRVINVVKGVREGSVIPCPTEHRTSVHPTQKPVRLMERLLALISDEGDTIFDPFIGSASTGVAAINMNRNFIGCEIDEEYYNIAKDRIAQSLIEFENKKEK